MIKKVFISYSHKDEAHRETLEEHLSMLQQNGIVDIWHDRKITAGQEWKGQIDKNLESANIIIFMVSSSFLASPYCRDVEVQRALERYHQKEATIISIIVRPCDWMDSGFSKIQALPKDAVPIIEWPNADRAWLNVVEGLKKHIAEFYPTVPDQKQLDLENMIRASDSTLEWIDDTEIVLTHRKVDKVKLSQVYVSTDLERERSPKSKQIEIVDSGIVCSGPGFYLISGEEQQGKTAFLKQCFKTLLLNFHLPIYIDCSNVKKSDVDKLIRDALEKQYKNLSKDKFDRVERKIFLLDNFDRIQLNEKYRDKFLSSLLSISDWIIVTCHESFGYVASEVSFFEKFSKFEMLGFGNNKREEAIKKWISLGNEECIEDKELYTRCDELKIQLDAIIKKNIVPAKPVYILMLLQMFEAYVKQNLELTSHGHCYQQLIYQSFENAKIKGTEVEKYLKVLTEIAWFIFINRSDLNSQQLDNFFDDYKKQYLPVDKEKIVENLLDHSILARKGNRLGFKYPYIYYFFVGKKIAEDYSETDLVKDAVNTLLGNLHREDYANILIFITHHTKDSWLLQRIKNVLADLFREQKKANLTKEQLAFMDEFIKDIPVLVIEQREIHTVREQHNKHLDELERENGEETGDEAEELVDLDLLANINKTFKGMEIAGQIIRNRHATLTRSALYELASDGASTGLRFLDYFISISDSSKNEIIKFIGSQLELNPNLTNQQIQSHAEGMYLHLIYNVINAVVRKIAHSIGSKEATEIYLQLEKNENTPAFCLIKLAIELQFNRSLDITSIQKTAETLAGNLVCTRILKELIIQHIYMFPVEYKTKQQLSDLLNISLKGQRLMDLKKSIKG